MKEIKNVYTVSALNWATNKMDTSFYLATSFETALKMAYENFRDRNYEMQIKAISLLAEDINE